LKSFTLPFADVAFDEDEENERSTRRITALAEAGDPFA
jgi:hypothetical protein